MRITSVRIAGIMLSLLVAQSACKADTIGISLTQSSLPATAGSAVTFSGTLANSTAATVFLNSAGINLSGSFSPSDEDTTPFLVNAPFSLGPGGSTSSIGLFTIDVPRSIASGLYSGTFTVLGGTDENAQDVVGSADFTVQIGSTSPVPEPGSISFLVIGAICITSCARRRFAEVKA